LELVHFFKCEKYKNIFSIILQIELCNLKYIALFGASIRFLEEAPGKFLLSLYVYVPI